MKRQENCLMANIQVPYPVAAAEVEVTEEAPVQ
jgi:hypothetical protein